MQGTIDKAIPHLSAEQIVILLNILNHTRWPVYAINEKTLPYFPKRAIEQAINVARPHLCLEDKANVEQITEVIGKWAE